MCGGSTTVAAPQPTPEERGIQSEQLRLMQEQSQMQQRLLPFMLESSGIIVDPETGAYSAAPQDELSQLLEEKALLAARGELPLSPMVQEQFAAQEQQLEETLSRRLGPNWRETTPGIQALEAFRQRRDIVTDEMRRGETTASTSLLGSREGLMAGIGGQNLANYQGAMSPYGSMAGQYGGLLQPYQQQRGMDFQASMANAENKAKRDAGMMNLAGSVLGIGAGYGMSKMLMPKPKG